MVPCLGVPVCRQVYIPPKWPLEPDQTRHRPDPHARRTPCQDFQGLLCAHSSRLHLRPLLGLPGRPHLPAQFQGHGGGRVRLPLIKQISNNYSIYILKTCNKTLFTSNEDFIRESPFPFQLITSDYYGRFSFHCNFTASQKVLLNPFISWHVKNFRVSECYMRVLQYRCTWERLK